MTKKKQIEMTYRVAILPGIGRVQVPAHLSDEDVLAEIFEQPKASPSKKKSSKKA